MNVNHLFNSAHRWLKKLDCCAFKPTVSNIEIMFCYQEACLEVEKIDFSFMRKKFQRENPRANEKIVNRYISEKKKELIEYLYNKKINYQSMSYIEYRKAS